MKVRASHRMPKSAPGLVSVITLIVFGLAASQPAVAKKEKKRKKQAAVGHVEHDPSQSTSVTTLASPIRLKGTSRRSPCCMSMTPRKIEDRSGTRYDLKLHRDADDPLLIEDGESLVLLVDGMRMGLSGEGSRTHRRMTDRGSVQELAFYDVTPGQLEKIAGAKEISLRLFGERYYTERTIKARDLERLARWVDEYVEAEPELQRKPALPVVALPGLETTDWCRAMLERKKVGTALLLKKCKAERPEEQCRKCLRLS
jgi:hypothetical protein